jgi:hypothetical protein
MSDAEFIRQMWRDLIVEWWHRNKLQVITVIVCGIGFVILTNAVMNQRTEAIRRNGHAGNYTAPADGRVIAK